MDMALIDKNLFRVMSGFSGTSGKCSGQKSRIAMTAGTAV